jgi:putative sigma-54 modulation protein
MNISITTRGYKAPERLKSYLTDKIKRLDRFSDQIMNIDTIFSYEKLNQVVEFKVQMRKKHFIVKEKSDDIFKSIDLAIDNVERQITKIKEKIRENDKRKITEMVE